jgi:hypothetical protein
LIDARAQGESAQFSTRRISTNSKLTAKARYLEFLRQLHLIASKFTLGELSEFRDISLTKSIPTEKLLTGLRGIREDARVGSASVPPRVSVRRALNDSVLFDNPLDLAQYASNFFQRPFETKGSDRENTVDKIMEVYLASDKFKQALFKQALTARMKALMGKEDKRFREYYEAWERQIKGN